MTVLRSHRVDDVRTNLVNVLLDGCARMLECFLPSQHFYSHQASTFLDDVLDDVDGATKTQALQ